MQQIIALTILSTLICSSMSMIVGHERCDTASSISDTLQCWKNDKDGEWMVGPDVLDIDVIVEDTDWDAFLDNTRNVGLKQAITDVLEPAGGIPSIGLGFAIIADDAIYSEDAKLIRGRMCRGLKQLVTCVAAHTRHCKSALDTTIDRLPLLLNQTDMRLPPNVKSQAVMEYVSQMVCYLCDDEGEGLKSALETALDGDKRKQIQSYLASERRIESYRGCQEANNKLPASATADDYSALFKSKPCEFYPYMQCLTRDIHTELFQPQSKNILSDFAALTFSQILQCDVDAPKFECQLTDRLRQISDSPINAELDSSPSSSNRNLMTPIFIMFALAVATM